MKDAALAYAKIGLPVFPCKGKQPLTPRGFKDATIDPAIIDSWWTSFPDAQIGIPTGPPSQIIAIDCDGEKGIRDFEELEGQHLPIARTIRSRTGGNGLHVIFAYPSDERIGNRTKVGGTSIDVRGDGGYIIVAPSDHKSGRNYEWEISPFGTKPAVLPSWLRDFITKRKSQKSRPAWLVGVNLSTAPGLSEGQRHDAACRLIGAHLGRGESREAVLKKALDWNQKNEPPLPDDELQQIVFDLSDKEATKEKPTETSKQRARLMEIAEDCELFRSLDGECFATFRVGEHRENWPIGSSRFRRWLIRSYLHRYGDSPRPEHLKTAIDALAAKASFDAESNPVFVRVGYADDAIYIDLGDDAWQVGQITAEGWRIVTETASVKFKRGTAMRPLATPTRNGSLEGLRKILNIDDDSWPLLIGWLVASMRPHGPFPILVLYGEQGGSKSTTTRILRSIVDPNAAAIRSEPRNVQDLMIAAKHCWQLAFDNLSKIPQWLSDALCRLATGGAFGARQLYTDSEETLIEASRPVILTSIAEIATRPDLLDRCIVIQLPPIPANKRRTEADLFGEFEEQLPGIIGALLDAVVFGVRNLPTTKLSELPRMADFARWVVACEPGLNLEPGQFLGAYQANRSTARHMALESSPIFRTLLDYFRQNCRFEGTAQEFLDTLNHIADETTRDKPSWPASARYLATLLRELAPSLREIGFQISDRQTSGSQSRKVWKIERPKDGVDHDDAS